MLIIYIYIFLLYFSYAKVEEQQQRCGCLPRSSFFTVSNDFNDCISTIMMTRYARAGLRNSRPGIEFLADNFFPRGDYNRRCHCHTLATVCYLCLRLRASNVARLLIVISFRRRNVYTFFLRRSVRYSYRSNSVGESIIQREEYLRYSIILSTRGSNNKSQRNYFFFIYGDLIFTILLFYLLFL